MFLTKYYSTLQKASVTDFTVSELLRKNSQERRGELPPSHPINLSSTHTHTHTQIEVNGKGIFQPFTVTSLLTSPIRSDLYLADEELAVVTSA